MFVLKKKYKNLFKRYSKLAKKFMIVWNKKVKLKQTVANIQETFNRETERLEKKLGVLENHILNYEEKNQNFFYKKEKELKEQVELGIIDNKEYHYSMRLLREIENALE